MEWLPETVLVGSFAVANHIAGVAVVAVGPHSLAPPGVAEAGCQQATTGALNDSTSGLLSNAVVLRALRRGNVVREPSSLDAASSSPEPSVYI